MKANELFKSMDPVLGMTILGFLRDDERELYRTALASLAVQRKFRPVFVQRMKVADQQQWMLKNLALRGSEEIAEHVLQVWLMKARQGMLTGFLDDLGIEHDGEGSVDELPETLEADRVAPAVDRLFANYPAPEVVLYLHVFQLQIPEGWAEIQEILTNDARVIAGMPKS